MKKLSVIVPAFNEEHRIGATLLDLHNYLKNQPYDFEILAVVDGASDNTRGAIREVEPQVPKLRMIDNKDNHGKGWVVRQGMLAASGDVCLFTDADNSTSITHIEKFLPFLDNGFDVVIGSIELPGAQIHENAQWYRRVIGHWSKYLIRAVAGLWEIHDTQRGFKVFTNLAAQKIFSRATIDRWGFDIEVLAIAKHLGFKIKEVPVVWNNPGESKVTLSSYFSTLMDLFKVRLNLWSGKYL